MFGFGKKRISADDFALTGLLALTPPRHVNKTTAQIDEFLDIFPEYNKNADIIKEEVQWLLMAVGIISVRIKTNPPTSSLATGGIIKILRLLNKDNLEMNLFDEDFLSALSSKITEYAVRFNRGIILRNESNDVFQEAVLDVANEFTRYIPDNKGVDEIDMYNILTLQSRGTPNNLEVFISNMINEYLGFFSKELKKYRIKNVAVKVPS